MPQYIFSSRLSEESFVQRESSAAWLPYLELSAGRAGVATSRTRLVCFPYAGGSALVFRNWMSRADTQIEVCPVQLPGRGRRLGEPPFTDLPPLMDALFAAVGPYLDERCALLGHSLGALIAFELAHRLLAERGLTVAHLFVSGRRAPQLPDRHELTYALPEPEFIQELKRLNGTPAEVLDKPEILQLHMPTLRADFQLGETYAYRPRPPLACAITAFGGTDDRDVSRDDLLAWQLHTTGPLRVELFPGDHFFLHPMEDRIIHTVERALLKPATTVDGG
jgi:medium-chain acyl-[acyl-carrier-protein] hydrolase